MRRVRWSLFTRGLRALLLGFVGAVVIIVATLILIVGTEAGTRQTLQLVAGRLAPLDIGNSSGSLLGGVLVDSLRWHDTAVDVRISQLQLQLAPGALLAGELRLPRLAAAEVSVEVKASEQTPPAATTLPTPALPTLALPLTLAVHELHVAQLRRAQTDSETTVQLSVKRLRWAGNRVDLRDGEMVVGATHLQLSGDIALSGRYPLAASFAVRDARLPGELRGAIGGSLQGLDLTAELSGEQPLSLKAELAPLAPGLPFSLNASVPRAVALHPSATLQSAQLQASGDLQTFHGEISAALEDRYYGASHLQATIAWQSGELSVSPLRWRLGENEDATLALACSLQTDELAWHCSGALRQLPLDPWLGQRSGGLSTTLSASGQWQDTLRLDARLDDLAGNLGGDTLRGTIHVRTADGEQWQLQELQLATNGNRIEAHGQFGASNALNLLIDAPRLQQLYPPLAGVIAGELTLSGSWPQPSLAGHIQARDLRYGDYRLARIDSRLNLRRLGAADSRWQAEFAELALAQRLLSGTLTLSGDRERQQLALNARDTQGNALQLQCAHELAPGFGQGRLSCPNPTGTLAFASETVAWTAQPVQLRWARAPAQLDLQPLCLSAEQGRLCLHSALAYRDGELQPFSAALTELPLAWPSSYLPYPLQWHEDARANLQLQFRQQLPLAMAAQLALTDTHWRWPTTEGDASGSLHDAGAELEVNAEQATLRARAGSSNLGELSAHLVVTEPMTERRVDGELQLQRLQLADFAWLAPQLNRLEGRVGGRVQLGGTTAAPTLTGQVQVRDGTVETPALAEAIENIALDTTFSRERADFGGRFQLGGGNGTLHGEVTLPADGWQLKARLETQSVAITPLPDSRMTLSSALTLEANPASAKLSGQVDVERADIRLRELPPDTYDVSSDAVIVGEERETAPLQLYADIGINLGKHFLFTGFGADVNLEGKLRVRQQPGQTLAGLGEVVVSEGRYRAYGQRLTVRDGSFLFDGPLDNPDLRLEAIRDMPPGSEVVVGVRVTGPLQNPSAELFSEPPRPETETAYYLLTGRPPAQFGQATQMSAESALLAIGLAGSNEKAAKVAKRVGIEDFQLGTATGELGTEAQASGYLSSRLYVRYGTGISQGGNSVTFQYRLTDKLLLEAVSGIEQALDLLYSFSID